MAILNIRNLPDQVHRNLRLRAAHAGRSMEAEARKILSDACTNISAPVEVSEIREWVDTLYGQAKPQHVVEDLINERRHESADE